MRRARLARSDAARNRLVAACALAGAVAHDRRRLCRRAALLRFLPRRPALPARRRSPTGAPALKGERRMTVRFDANVAPGLPWTFEPETPSIALRTGRDRDGLFQGAQPLGERDRRDAPSTTSRPTLPAPISTRSPASASASSISARGESAELPVVFFLDPALERDRRIDAVDEITLSYTLFAAPVGQAGRARRAAAQTDKSKL